MAPQGPQRKPLPHLASWRRKALGLIALGCIVAGLTGLIFYRDKSEGFYMISTIMWRVGLTLGTLWLAFPQMADFFARYPPPLLATYLAGLIIMAWRTKTIILVVPALVLITFLWPRKRG